MTPCALLGVALVSSCAVLPEHPQARPVLAISDRPRGCQPADKGRIKPPRHIREARP